MWATLYYCSINSVDVRSTLPLGNLGTSEIDPPFYSYICLYHCQFPKLQVRKKTTENLITKCFYLPRNMSPVHPSSCWTLPTPLTCRAFEQLQVFCIQCTFAEIRVGKLRSQLEWRSGHCWSRHQIEEQYWTIVCAIIEHDSMCHKISGCSSSSMCSLGTAN